MFNFPLTKTSQQRKTARHCKTLIKSNIVSIGSSVCFFFTKFRANRDCLLKLCMLVKSARTVSREFYREKTCLYCAYFIWLAEGVATILCCCAKLVFMLFTIGLWHKAGLLKLCVAAPIGVAKCNFGVVKPIGLKNQI